MQKSGFVDLSNHVKDLTNKTQNAIDSRWLDASTAYSFKRELHAVTQAADIVGLQRLHDKATKEVERRKTKYGVS